MDINNSLSSQIKVDKSINARPVKKSADASPIREVSASGTEQAKTAELKEGQIIRGQIIDHRYNKVTIKLESSSQIITARLSDEISLNIGETASFIVSEADSGELVIKLLPDTSGTNEAVIQKALMAANLTITDRSKAIVQELLSQRLPVDKHTLQTLIRLSAKHHDASPLCLVLMYKNKIPINAGNIQQFQAYLNGTHQLLYKIQNISAGLSKILNLSSDINPQTTNSAIYQSLPAAGTGQAGTAFTENNQTSNINMHQGQDVQAQALSPFSFAASQTDTANNMLQNLFSVNDRLLDICLSTVGTENQQQAQGQAIALHTNGRISEPSGEYEAAGMLPNTAKLSDMQPNAASLADIMEDSEVQLLLKHLSAAPDTNGIRERIAGKSASAFETLAFIKESLPNLDKNQLIRLLTGAEYSKLLEQAFFKKWTLAAENVSKKNLVKNFYKQLEADLKEINRLLSSLSESDDKAALTEPLDKIQNNLQFMKDLNNAFAFIQLPVDFKNSRMHADLYVLNRKKALNDGNQSLTVHLYLETENLGKLNIHLKLSRNRIDAIFYPEESEAAGIIKDNLPMLVSNLQQKGYTAVAEVQENTEKANLFQKLIGLDMQDSMTRYSFDIRT